MTEIVESKLTTVRTGCGARDGFDSSFFSVIHRTVGSIKYRGLSVYEYDWNAEEDQILSHAMEVAADLELDLLMEAPSPNPIKYSHNAA